MPERTIAAEFVAAARWWLNENWPARYPSDIEWEELGAGWVLHIRHEPGLSYPRRSDVFVESVQQALDVLVDLNILPAARFSSVYRAGRDAATAAGGAS